MQFLTDATVRDLKDKTHKVITQWFPSEVPFFEDLWSLFETVLKKPLDSIEPDDFQVCTTAETLATELGFSMEKTLDLVTPRLLAAFWAIVFDVTKYHGVVPSGYLSKVVKQYGQSFRVPNSFLPQLEELASSAIRADFEQAGIFPTGDMGHNELTLIRWDSPTKTGRKAELTDELEKIRARKGNFDLFLDDLRNEFLLGDESGNLPLKQRQLFVLLMIRVGDYWGYADLFEKLWGDVTTNVNRFHQLLKSLHETTKGVLKSYVVLPPGQERCYIRDELRHDVKYVLIFVTGAY